jgi:hypothetical protein
MSRYSEDQILKAAGQLAITGNITQAADYAGIPMNTVYDWTRGHNEVSQRFQALTKEFQSQQGARIRAGLASVVDKAIGLLHDRLDNGDEVLSYDSKTGQHVAGKRKMSGKDIGILAAIAIDKRIMLDKGDQGDEQVSKVDTLIARLESLAGHYTPAITDDSIDVTPDKHE